MEEAVLPAPATKFKPCTEKGKLSTAPAITLDGRITSIAGPLVMVTAAVADFVASARLGAMPEMPLGERGAGGGGGGGGGVEPGRVHRTASGAGTALAGNGALDCPGDARV